MLRWTLVVLALAAAWTPAVAEAHPEGSTGVALSYRATHVSADLQIPLEELGFALGRPLPPAAARTAHAELEEYVRTHIVVTSKGTAWAVEVGGARIGRPGGVPSLLLRATLRPPNGKVTAFTMRYGVVVDDLDTHRAFVTVADPGGKTRTLDIITFRDKEVRVPVPGARPDRSHAFGAMVRLGLHHIADGTDHILFLVTLLLPASLLAVGRLWIPAPSAWRAGRRIVHVVTAFAVGHSLTLAAAATGLLDVPRRPVEVLIAFSIAVSALHAVRPLVPGGEAAIAFTFGLVHGVGFAEALRELGLTGSDLVLGLLGFNLGIELAQLVVVVLLMPSLWLLSRTRAYAVGRVAVGAVAIVAAVTWMANRAGLVDANPLESGLDTIVSRPLVVAGVLAAAAAAVTVVERRRQPPARLST